MSSYYQFPQSSPSPFSGGGHDLLPDPYQRPPSTLLEKIQSYPPDVYTPLSTQPSQPFPQPGRVPGRTYSSRPESPGLLRSSSGWSPSQAPESYSPIPKIPKTFLQWKAEAQATSDDYQRNGFPSPVAWVLSSCHFTPPLLCNLRIM